MTIESKPSSPPVPHPTVAFIMSTKGREEVFAKSIQALVGAVQGFLGTSILVVNDAKGTPVALPKSCLDSVKVVDNLGTGYAANMNTGPRTVRADYYVFIDNDIIADRPAIERIFAFIRQHPEACLHPNWSYPPDLLLEMRETPFGRFLLKENVWHLKGWHPGEVWEAEKMFEAEILPSNMLLVPRKVFEHVGGFNEEYTYLSIDDEFTRRAKGLSYKLFIDPTITVLHNEEDRLTLEPKLERFYVGGQTRKKRVKEGDSRYECRVSFLRQIILCAVSWLKRPLIRLANGWPNWPAIDFLYFKLAAALVMVALHDGYYGNEWPEL